MGKQQWFETVIDYEKIAEEGKVVKVKEHYMVDALTHAEAENRIIAEQLPFVSGALGVMKVQRKKISEVFYHDGCKTWYKAKLMFTVFDEEKGIEKNTPSTILVEADDVEQAIAHIKMGMKGSMASWKVYSITETPILDLYKYEPSTI